MIQDTKDKILRLIQGRIAAYSMVFDRNNKYTNQVLKDLARFCRAHETTFHPDPRIHASLEGRREVWLRISEHLNLNDDELFELHKIKDIPK